MMIRVKFLLSKHVASFFLSVILLVVSLTVANRSAEAVVAGGLAAYHYAFSERNGNYDRMSIPVKVTVDGGDESPSGSNYFLATEFGFENGFGGYMGFQNVGGSHWMRFSIWNAAGWKYINPIGACSHFSHEGNGVQCAMPYEWREGVAYMYELKEIANDVWEGSVVDQSNGVRTVVSQIEVPSAWGLLVGHVSGFVEEFSQGRTQLASCDDANPFSATVGPVVLNGSVSPSRATGDTYGNCSSIAEAGCDGNNICSASVNIKLTQVDASRRNNAVGLASNDEIYHFNGSSWSKIQGELAHVSMGLDGSIWGVNSSGQIWRKSSVNGGWSNVPGALVQIDARDYNHAIGVNAYGDVYRYDNGTWFGVSGKHIDTSYGTYGAIWTVNSSNKASSQ